ncbi:MAG: isoprenylcysteine carboxylmethyltransferase family protein [Pseudomonadota bacterium]
MYQDPRINRLIELSRNAVNAPPGARRIVLALSMGLLCHTIFAAAILSMIYAMFFGLTRGLGDVPYPWALAANLALILQFPVAHSLLLTRRGLRALALVLPGQYGRPLSTTTYAIIASLQLLALFWLWTPSGIVWWQAEGVPLYAVTTVYALAWLVLGKAIFDAGAELQSGALGWLSVLAKRAPKFPDMPTLGLFKIIRQPIYFAFALTLWLVPVWTPDQLALAIVWTAYCVAAPRLKERRFSKQFGQRFTDYQARIPYMWPRRAESPPPPVERDTPDIPN